MTVATEVQRLRLRGRRKVAAPLEAAHQLLVNPATSAVALLGACKELLGNFHQWEPETLWLELEHRGIDLAESTRSKIQAALSLLFVPSFYWDAITFEKTALAFDHAPINPDLLEEATPAQLAWAVLEAAWVISMHLDPPQDFSHEPRAYAAVVLYRDGFVLAPTQLAFSQGLLDNHNARDPSLQERVRNEWYELDKSRMDSHAFAETPVDVQLARLAVVELHVRDREKQAAADLATLF